MDVIRNIQTLSKRFLERITFKSDQINAGSNNLHVTQLESLNDFKYARCVLADIVIPMPSAPSSAETSDVESGYTSGSDSSEKYSIENILVL